MDKSKAKKELDHKFNNEYDSAYENALKNVDLSNKLMVLTYESTYNSWMSVGLGALVGGLYIARVLYLEDKSTIMIYVGLSAVLASLIIFLLSFVFFKKNMEKVKNKQAETSAPITLVALVTLILSTGSVLSLILILRS